MRRLLWLAVALATLWAIHRLALVPIGPQVVTAPAKDDERPGRHVVYEVSRARPLELLLERGALQVRMSSTLDLPGDQFTGPDAEYSYHLKATFLDAANRPLASHDSWHRTRKIRSAGGAENVSYGMPELLACEARTAILPVPAGALKLRLEWPAGQTSASAAVRCLEQVRAETDSAQLARRWASLGATTRERLARARATGAEAPSLDEMARAVSAQWRRMAPAGNPGRDYERRYLHLSAQPIEYTAPRRPAPTTRAATGAAVATGPAVFNLFGPGSLTMTSPSTATVSARVRVVSEAGPLPPAQLAISRSAPGEVALGPGLHTVEVLAGSPLEYRSSARPADPRMEATAATTGPLRPSISWTRAWAAGPGTTGPAPTIDAPAGPRGEDFALRIVALAPAGSSGLTLTARVLDARGRLLQESMEPLTLETSPEGAPRATAYMVLEAPAARVELRAASSAALAFATRLDSSSRSRPAAAAHDREAGIERWMPPGPRQWFPIEPSNAPALLAAGRLAVVSAPLRALAEDRSPRTSAEPGVEPVRLPPLGLAEQVRLLEQLEAPLEPGDWEPTMLRALRPGERLAGGASRIVYLLGSLPAALTAFAGSSAIGHGRPASARGELRLRAAEGGVTLAGSREGDIILVDAPGAGEQWRERTYQVLDPGGRVGFGFSRDGAADRTVNFVIAPVRQSKKNPDLVLEAKLDGPRQRRNVLLKRMTARERVLLLDATLASSTLWWSRKGPALARPQAAGLSLGSDCPPGDYSWTLRVQRGRGALLRAFVMERAGPSEGKLWVSTRM